MKMMTMLSVLAISTSAFATEFKAHISDIDCSISSKGVVTRTQSIGKNGVSFTETKTVKFNNVEAIIPKVIEVSPEGAPRADEEYSYSMVHEGKLYTLSANDSKESLFLVRMITHTCR